MEIKFTFRHNVYSINIGYTTAWFEQISFITIVREEYNHRKEIDHAVLLWKS